MGFQYVERVLSQKPGSGGFVAVFALKNPGEGCVDRGRSQKPLVGVVLTVFALKNPEGLTVFALKNPVGGLC